MSRRHNDNVVGGCLRVVVVKAEVELMATNAPASAKRREALYPDILGLCFK
jgi:hypothetical protein